jgi:hypothetical protein
MSVNRNRLINELVVGMEEGASLMIDITSTTSYRIEALPIVVEVK